MLPDVFLQSSENVQMKAEKNEAVLMTPSCLYVTSLLQCHRRVKCISCCDDAVKTEVTGCSHVCLLSWLCVPSDPARRRGGGTCYQATAPPPARGAGCSLGQHTCFLSLAANFVFKGETSSSKWFEAMLPTSLAGCGFPAASLHVCAYVSVFTRCHISPNSTFCREHDSDEVVMNNNAPIIFLSSRRV